MIELPPKFKQALGNGMRTSLYPLVRIYKDYRIDDTIPNDVESINLSSKETVIKNLNDTYENYNPLLLNSPSIRSSADIINNKYTISSVSLSISNAQFQGKIFSDSVQSLLNAVCQVYYCANGIDNIEDCLLVYTGTIRRFSQSAETIKLELEDLTEQVLSTKIPTTLIPDDPAYKEEDIGKPYPMVYGYVDGQPLITKMTTKNSPTDTQIISQLEIDKPDINVVGAWNQNPEIIYNSPYINNNHMFFDADKNLLSKRNYLKVYENGFVGIMEDAVGNAAYPWRCRWVNNDGEEGFRSVDFEGTKIYSFHYADGDNSPNIKIDSRYKDFLHVNDEDSVDFNYLPTRIYRPIVHAIFGNQQARISGNQHGSIFQVYGFNYLGNWDPREQSLERIDGYNGSTLLLGLGNVAEAEYENNLNSGNLTWWEPTDVNENVCLSASEGITYISPLVWSDTDENYSENKYFNVNTIQNNRLTDGLHINSAFQNYVGAGGIVCQFKLAEVGDFEAVTNIFWQVGYFTPNNLDVDLNYGGLFGGESSGAVPTRFWSGKKVWLSSENDMWDNLLHMLLHGSASHYRVPSMLDEILEEVDVLDSSETGASVTVENFSYSGGLRTTNDISFFNWGYTRPIGINDNPEAAMTCVANLYNAYILQDIKIRDVENRKFYADIIGREKNGQAISSVSDIIKHILEEELNYGIEISEDNIFTDWMHGFCLSEQKEAKQVFEGLFKSSLIIPSFNSEGQLKFIPIHQILSNIQYNKIDNQHILKYSFSLTKLEDVKNSVNVKYQKNYASGEFDKQTGYSLIDSNQNEFDNYDKITESMYPNDESKWYSIDYYGLTSEEAKLEVETEYIRDDDTARKLQKRLVSWYANQHLIVKVDLPVSYMNLEVGDYIKFSEVIGGKLAFGYDYSRDDIRNGQVIYPVFFINKISKSLDKISIEAVQVHRGEYGSVPIIDDEDDNDGTVTDNGGNDGQGNFDLPDPNDNPNYGDDTVIDEEEQDYQFEYFNSYWENNDNNIDNNPTAIIDTNLEGNIEYQALITHNDQVFNYGTNDSMPIVTEDDEPYYASNYFNFNLYSELNNDGNTVVSGIRISTPHLIPWEELEDGTIIPHNGIQGILKIYYEGTEHSMDLDFFQNYVEPIDPVLGDANGDGIIDILDIVILSSAAVDPAFADEILSNYPQADINQDGMLNVLDVVEVVDIVLHGTGDDGDDGDEGVDFDE